MLYLIASGKAGCDVSAGFASNGDGDRSPGKYSLLAALVAEVVMTMMFLPVILGATDKRAPAGFAPLGIGLCPTLIHLISIPVTNSSVNPARSSGMALFVVRPRWRDHRGSAVVFLTRSSTKLVLQSSTLGWRSSVSITKRE